jgi:hypothetical protein
MKHWVVKLCLFVLLLAFGGAIVNVAVAWGSAALKNDCEQFPQCSSGVVSNDYWRVSRFRVASAEFIACAISPMDAFDYPTLSLGCVPTWTRFSEIHDVSRTLIRAADARGWPLLSMWTELRGDTSQNAQFLEVRGGAQIGQWSTIQIETFGLPRVVPYRVIWPGFAINTAFYASVLWMLLALPGAVRRFVRRRRGRCTRCGYDLRGQTVVELPEVLRCPECGTVNSLSLAGRGLG